jgi:inner membrane protein
MPSPVAHSLMGYIIYLLSTMRASSRKGLLFLVFILVANIPDIDFLPGILMGDIRRFHHGITHSILFSIYFGLLISSVCYLKRIERFNRAFTLAFALYFSHILLDYFVLSPGRGVPFFWPFSAEKFMIGFVIFPTFNYVSPDGTLTIFSFHNLRTMIVETLILTPFIAGAFYIRDRRSSANVKEVFKIFY